MVARVPVRKKLPPLDLNLIFSPAEPHRTGRARPLGQWIDLPDRRAAAAWGITTLSPANFPLKGLLIEFPEQEHFLLVTTDVERAWVMRRLYELGQGSINIERHWRIVKCAQLLPQLSEAPEPWATAWVGLGQIAALVFNNLVGRLRTAHAITPSWQPSSYELLDRG